MKLTDNVGAARRFLAAVMVIAAVMVLADIDYGWRDPATKEAAATGAATPSAARAQVDVTPADDAKKVRPDRPVVIRASGGRLTSVEVTSKKGRAVAGTYNATHTTWTSKWAMSPDTRYQVKAVAENADQVTTEQTSTFRTLRPRATFRASANTIAPDRSTVGVGFPLVVGFSVPVEDQEAVERALEVKMSEPVEGGWYWTSDTEVVFRPREYWPAHEKIHLVGHFAGVRAAKGVFGKKNLSMRWTVGERVIVKASSKTKRLTVYENGKKVNGWPVSMGRGGEWKYFTTSGVHLTMGKSSPERMISPGIKKGEPGYYDELIYWAVRISNSGEFVHAMPSTVWAQGRSNVSHGCVNSPPKKAQWFYNFEHPGDVVVITGTPRKLEWNNGWGYWQKSWKAWQKGSALDGSGATRP